jgi:hypothetical protein
MAILNKLCPPAMLYVGFSLAQILIDTVKGMYNTAMFKFLVMIIFTILLNTLCRQGLGIISWFIVFIPFLMMTFLTSILLFVFDLSPNSGSLKYDVHVPEKKTEKKNEKAKPSPPPAEVNRRIPPPPSPPSPPPARA